MLERATKTSLAETAAGQIRQEILCGRWALGQRIPNEPTLSSLLDVSRGTVREAVKMLVSQGMLEPRQGSGTYVCANYDLSGSMLRMRRATLRDQVETRCALEVEATRLAAMRHTQHDIDHLNTLLKQRGHSRDKQSDAAFIGHDFAFHVGVVRASHNRALTETYLFFSASVQDTIKATLDKEIPEPGYEAHQSIIDAIQSRDPDAAAATARQLMAPILADLNGGSTI
jgi:DNA-binding FadR family transcriptional regulator